MKSTSLILVGSLMLATQQVVAKDPTRRAVGKDRLKNKGLRKNRRTPDNQNRRQASSHYDYSEHGEEEYYYDYGYDYYGYDDAPVLYVEGDDWYGNDDAYYYYGTGGKGKGGKSSKKGSKKGGSGSGKGGSTEIYLPRPTILVVGQAFTGTYNASVPVDTAAPDLATPGAVFIYDSWASDPENLSAHRIPIHVGYEDGTTEADYVWITADGLCTRTGTASNTVQGYCHYTYTVLDPYQDETNGYVPGTQLATFTAEGPLSIPFGALVVTGGTGILTGASGMVELAPAIIDTSLGDPLVTSQVSGDPLTDAGGYLHYFELLALEELLVAPTLY